MRRDIIVSKELGVRREGIAEATDDGGAGTQCGAPYRLAARGEDNL